MTDRLPNLPRKPFVPASVRHGQSDLERERAKREAIIEHNRLMKAQREWAAANRDRINAEWDALTCPPRTIEGHLADWEGR